MRINKILILYILFVCVLFAIGLYLLPKKPIHFPYFPLFRTLTYTKPPSQITKVIRVVDGDTIEIKENIKIRYIGIDTPETVDPKKSIECYGQEASIKNKELVEGKTIRMEKDISETDQYGRLLKYVWLIDQNASSSPGLFINDFLVREGFAYAATFPPDVSYAKQFVEAQKEAQNNNRGLWSKCK